MRAEKTPPVSCSLGPGGNASLTLRVTFPGGKKRGSPIMTILVRWRGGSGVMQTDFLFILPPSSFPFLDTLTLETQPARIRLKFN
jgi:hypothetical protein